MSKLQERLPSIPRQDVLPITRSVVADVITNGRVETEALTNAIVKRLESEQLGEETILREARKSIAQQFISAWANNTTIKLDRTQRVPVYQPELGFKDSYFKVGSTYVKPEAMTVDDFTTMLERIDHRIETAQTDRSILARFYEIARPGLEAGQNLVQQFEAGTLELAAAHDGTFVVEAGEE
jgi:hypothetical protein